MKIDLHPLQFEWVGLSDYDVVLKRQKEIAAHLRESQTKAGWVLGTEHREIITLGHRAIPEEEILNLESHWTRTDRGGLATLHAPGQLVIYPIVPISLLGLGVKDWVCALLKISMNTLKAWGAEGLQTQDDGVYSTKGKLISVGIKVDRGVAYHGLALNLDNDLSLFSRIRTCGQAQRPMDRLVDLVKAEGVSAQAAGGNLAEEVFRTWRTEFIDFTKGQS